MSSADVIAFAPAEKELDEDNQMKFSGASAEKNDELDEATSNSSMKSPVTPAAISEQNGTAALRWKSYSAKKEPDSHGKLATPDPKGKLVINLCGTPRSLITSSSDASKMKPTMGKDMDNRVVTDASISSQEHALHGGDVRDSHVPIGAVGMRNSSVGSPESAPQCAKDMDLHRTNENASHLARKVCQKIKKVRQMLKASRRPKKGRGNLEQSLKKENFLLTRHSRRSNSVENLQTASNMDGDAVFKSKEKLQTNVAVEDNQEVTGSEDLIYSDDETCSQRHTLDKPVDHDARGAMPARDQQAAKTEILDQKNSGQMYHSDAILVERSGDKLPVDGIDNECTPKELVLKDLPHGRQGARSVSHDAGAFSETSKLDLKEQTVLETLLRDEPPGYSSAGGSEPSRSHRIERSCRMKHSSRSDRAKNSPSEDSETSDAESEQDDAEGSHTDEYDEEYSDSSDSPECEDEECNCNGLSPTSLGFPERVVADQVPSVLCDAEGNVWHIGKRAEQARGKARGKQFFPKGMIKKETLNFDHKVIAKEVQEVDFNETQRQSVIPFCHQIELNWKWPSDVDYTISSVGDMSNRSMVAKEKSVFVGCIPDGTENLEEVLQSLMEKFLERFDFAPAILGQTQLVKVVKDFAFLELVTEKVAHIVLAANQLDAFEWGVNGFHFNIEGCKDTHISVRPLIEYMPLKAARVIFVGNIPKSRWQKEYLEVFFARILRGSDGPADFRFVRGVYLLPESCDAYVELASEIMADAIVFKCSKNPQILREIGEDVFICRDSSSVPLMSKHKGIVSPQRSLFVGVSAPGQEFKIDRVRKIFEEILPMISRESNQPGYLEHISVQPGKDYAFFQFNSEAIVDAVMEEYIENTHLFVCSSSPMSYIILRPPGFERPGAKYRSGRNRQGGIGVVKPYMNKRSSKHDPSAGLVRTKQLKPKLSKQPGAMPLMLPRRFGDEPAKKADCVMSIGASPLPMATWNGLPSTGACAADPECMVVIEGLPKGFSYKLLRGALNELFEKSLSHTGLLEVGMLVLRHLDRDSNLDVVASLPSAKFVKALLSVSKCKSFSIAGHKIRLLSRGRRKITWQGNPAEYVRGQGEVSCLSDDEVYHGEEPSKYPVRKAPDLIRKKGGRSQTVNNLQARRKSAITRKGVLFDSEMWCEDESISLSPLSHTRIFRADVKGSLKVVKGSWKSPSSRLGTGKHVSALAQWMDRSKTSLVRNGLRPLKSGNREPAHGTEGRSYADAFTNEILHIVSEGGRRKIQAVGTSPKMVMGLGKPSVINIASKKRKLLHLGQDCTVPEAAYIQKRLKKRHQFSRLR